METCITATERPRKDSITMWWKLIGYDGVEYQDPSIIDKWKGNAGTPPPLAEAIRKQDLKPPIRAGYTCTETRKGFSLKSKV